MKLWRGGRRPVRLRLTLIYSGLFLAAGAALLAVTYGLVAQSFNSVPPSATAISKASKYVDQALSACKSEYTDPVALAKCEQQAEQSLNGVSKASQAYQRSRTLAYLLDYSLAALAALVVGSAWLGWIVAGRALRPVHAITAAARRASEENLSERIALAGPDDELKELADTFDAMLSRLESAFDSQKRFVANASHELRTPLSIIRTEVDVALADPDATPEELRRMGEVVRRATERSQALIDGLLVLARSDRGPAALAPVDLAALAQEAVTQAAAEAGTAGVEMTSRLGPAPTNGDDVMLGRLAGNLVENAIRHNESGGFVEVVTGSAADPCEVRLVVTNSGPVIDPADVDGLFEPFRRLGADRVSGRGAGLGLSIVRSVTVAHGGRVTARPRPGGGLVVEVILPGRESPGS